MSEYLIQDTTLEDIADAIRAKKGTQAGIQVSDFPSEIASIPTGSNGAVVNAQLWTLNYIPYSQFKCYFKYNNTQYALGVGGGAYSTGYISLFALNNGSWTEIAQLSSFNEGYIDTVNKSLQCLVKGKYLYYMYTDSSIHQYVVDLSAVTISAQSITIPITNSSYTYYLIYDQYGGTRLYMYCPNTDILYRGTPVSTTSGVLTWSEYETSCFGSTGSGYVVGCYYKGSTVTNPALYFARSDINNKLYRYDLNTYTGYLMTGSSHNAFNCMFNVNNRVYGLIPIIETTTYGPRIYSDCKEITMESQTSYAMSTFKTELIAQNNSIFNDGNNQYINGCGCWAYPDPNHFSPGGDYDAKFIIV